MKEIGNIGEESELKLWELIKTERKKIEKFRIEKEEKLEWKLLRARNRFFKELSKQEVEKIDLTITNKKEIEEFSKNLKKIIELDEREIRYETNKLLRYLRMKKN